MMSGKLKFEKDWRKKITKGRASAAPQIKLELEVIKSEDLPELISTKEAAKILRVHPKTVEEYRNTGRLQFLKKGGRYFTTAQWIAEHLEREAKLVLKKIG